jgi:hypothetical protein
VPSTSSGHWKRDVSWVTTSVMSAESVELPPISQTTHKRRAQPWQFCEGWVRFRATTAALDCRKEVAVVVGGSCNWARPWLNRVVGLGLPVLPNPALGVAEYHVDGESLYTSLSMFDKRRVTKDRTQHVEFMVETLGLTSSKMRRVS